MPPSMHPSMSGLSYNKILTNENWRVPRPVNNVPRARRANEHDIAQLTAKTAPMNLILNESAQKLQLQSFFWTNGRSDEITNERMDGDNSIVSIFPSEREGYKNLREWCRCSSSTMCHINFIRVSDMDLETELSNLTVHQTNIKEMHNFVT